MANIRDIWQNSKPQDSPEIQLRNAIIEAGLEPPKEINLDGKIHRFNSGTKGRSGFGDKSGWYIVYPDGIPAGKFGDWRLGLEHKFIADIGRKLAPYEEMAFSRKIEQARKVREAEEKIMSENVSEVVHKIWTEAADANSDHPYLSKKKINPNGARVTGDGRLIVPLYNAEGELTTLQYIDGSGNKLYHAGGKTGGSYWSVGNNDNDHIYVAEGFATASTIAETMHRTCYITYSASNIPLVVERLRDRYGAAKRIIVVADNDSSGVGRNYADQASAKFGVSVIMPPVNGDANDYLLSGNDLFELLDPPKIAHDWLVSTNDFRNKPEPISWLIKGWMQNNALMMVHGPSGSGKTFLVLDWCLRLASIHMEHRNWCDHRTKQVPVVYLAGEGHHGLRSRIAAWMQHHNVEEAQMWLSKSGTDLNMPEGMLKVVENIRALPVPPKVIVVDTLHRFLNGDENSAQDAKTMLDACATIMQEFDCSVVLVHHTGVSEEAQHRARGSSAWRGALDIEVSVKPGNSDKPIEVLQRKMKDAEESPSRFFDLLKVEIKGWKDEDNEQVSSVVLNEVSAPTKLSKKTSKVEENRKRFELAWHSSHRERDKHNRPHVTRSGLIDYLAGPHVGMSESYAKRQLQPTANTFIGILIDAGYIAPFERGWSAIHDSCIMDFGENG